MSKEEERVDLQGWICKVPSANGQHEGDEFPQGPRSPGSVAKAGWGSSVQEKPRAQVLRG